jgi:hypothetical protein
MYLSAMASKSYACNFMHLPYQLNLWLHIGFCLESCLIRPQPSQVSRCLPVLISCCGPTWPNLMVIFRFVLTLVNARRAWNYAKITCSVAFGSGAMLSCEVFWFANSFPVDSKPCDYLCLLSLLGMVLIWTTQSVPFEIPHRVYAQ